MRDEVVIVGGGPAGRAAAAACARAGLPAVVVARDPARPWRNLYGAWLDELAGLDLGGVVSRRYDFPLVRTDRVDRLVLERGYGLFDNEALQQHLRDRAIAGGVREVAGSARSVDHDVDGSVVHLADGRRLPAAVVIDASGHRPALARRGAGQAPAWQAAYGIIGRFEPAPGPPTSMTFMDWRTAGGGPGTATGPTFCYVLDLGRGLALAEETSLAARPALSLIALRERLERRLDADGITVAERVGVERVRFPMGGPAPPRDQRVVAFGAAAGMVHPATGYQVAAALRTAPALAAALADALDASGSGPADVAAAGWGAVWPADRLRQRALHALGLEVLLRFDARATQRFFEAFFTLPTEQWSAYVSGAPAFGDVGRVMLAVAARLPIRLRARLLRAAVGGGGVRLVRAFATRS